MSTIGTLLAGAFSVTAATIGLAADIPDSWKTLGGRPSDVQWTAKWIWTDGPESPRNVYLCARRDFEFAGEVADDACRLHIAADSRYRLYVNGEWVGDGPARSWAFAQQFDTYDMTGVLRPGRNTIAVLVSHYGEGTFQYDPSGKAGLLLQLERQQGDSWAPVVVSDAAWQVRPHEGYLRPTIRISCQMPFEEIFDASKMPADWINPVGSLPDARPAKVLGPVGTPPWKMMVARSVPFLTREPISPVRIWRAGVAQLPNFHCGLALRPYLLPGYFMQNAKELNGFAAAIIESPIDQEITIPRQVGRWEDPIINGVVAESNKPVALHKGENLLVIPVRPGSHHEYDRSYCGFVREPVKLKALFGQSGTWTVFGRFDNYAAVHEKVAKAKTAADLAAFKDKAQLVRAEDVFSHGSPWEESTAARFEPVGLTVENLDGLFGAGGRPAVIQPAKGGDPELFLDFGRELVGQTQIDVEAPAGTVLTFNFLEEIEDGKRIHYTDGNYGGFRYITAEGRNQFTTFLRRGYRYCKLIVSDASEPVRLRSIKTIFSTHPAEEVGSFACSDPLLNRIWEVGRHTLRCCSEDTFTDCPAYEQTYWVGDGRNEAMIDYAAYGNLALTRRCAELPALSLFRQPITESQVPSAWDNLLTGWSLLWVLMTEEHYQFSGDREYLAGIYPAVERMLGNIHGQFMDQRGLLSINAWNLFDWAGQDSGHALVTHNQMFLAEALKRGSEMAVVLGKAEDAKRLAGWRAELVAAINQHLWDEQRGAYVDAIHGDGSQSKVISQQTNSLALLYEVAPPERVARIKDVPVSPPKGMVTVGSPFALFYILEALAESNRQAELLAVVRKQWGEMVRHGATSFWETLPGFDPKWWTRSYCHAWSAAPTYFLSRYQLGAWWAEPGYKVARIAPQPVDLTWARGNVPTPHGPIAVAWEQSTDMFKLEVSLPAGVAGVVELPVAADQFAKTEVTGLTKPQAEAGNLRRENGRWVMNLPASAAATITAKH